MITPTTSLRDQVLYVLGLLHKGSADELSMELAEFHGLASEEGMAELTRNVGEELEALAAEGKVVVLHEHRQKKRYAPAAPGQQTPD